MSDVSEVTILEEGDVIITNQRAVIGTKTYPLSDIHAVKVEKVTSIFGCVILALVTAGLLFGVLSFGSENYSSYLRVGAFVLFGGALVVAILAPSSYTIQISSASGMADVLQSMDKDYLDRIAAAMNDAIAV